jgi:hypothetical protein
MRYRDAVGSIRGMLHIQRRDIATNNFVSATDQIAMTIVNECDN